MQKRWRWIRKTGEKEIRRELKSTEGQKQKWPWLGDSLNSGLTHFLLFPLIKTTESTLHSFISLISSVLFFSPFIPLSVHSVFFSPIVSFPLFALKKTETHPLHLTFLSSQDLASGKSRLSQRTLFFLLLLASSFFRIRFLLSFFLKQYQGWSRVAGIYTMVQQITACIFQRSSNKTEKENDLQVKKTFLLNFFFFFFSKISSAFCGMESKPKRLSKMILETKLFKIGVYRSIVWPEFIYVGQILLVN